MSETDQLINIENLTHWFDTNVRELGDGPLVVEEINQGSSNAIFSVKRSEGLEMILRRPPRIPPPGSEKTVLREARVLTALNATQVPHPFCYGSCEDTDVIGTAFYVMEKVDGWTAKLRGEKICHHPPFDDAPCEYGVAFALVDGLIALANVDYESIGLSDYGRPNGFLERQVERWEKQLHSYKDLYGYEGRNLPGYKLARNWLTDNIPDSFCAGIIHGDVGTTNAFFAFDRPARLTALIDWELSTIGDPLIDLAWFTNDMRDESEPNTVPVKSFYSAEKWPTRQEMARYYAAGTGRDIKDFDYFAILAMYKAGCILEYKVAQADAGLFPAEFGSFFSDLVLKHFSNAEKLIRKRG